MVTDMSDMRREGSSVRGDQNRRKLDRSPENWPLNESIIASGIVSRIRFTPPNTVVSFRPEDEMAPAGQVRIEVPMTYRRADKLLLNGSQDLTYDFTVGDIISFLSRDDIGVLKKVPDGYEKKGEGYEEIANQARKILAEDENRYSELKAKLEIPEATLNIKFSDAGNSYLGTTVKTEGFRPGLIYSKDFSNESILKFVACSIAPSKVSYWPDPLEGHYSTAY